MPARFIESRRPLEGRTAGGRVLRRGDRRHGRGGEGRLVFSMAIRQVRELLKRTIAYHKRACAYYASLGAHSRREAVRLVTEYLAGHEAVLARTLEDFIADELPESMAKRFHTRTDPAGTVMTGVSMGGYGTLKIGLRRPERFAAIASMEPGIEPGFERAAATPRNTFYRFPEVDAALWGDPSGPRGVEAPNLGGASRAHGVP